MVGFLLLSAFAGGTVACIGTVIGRFAIDGSLGLLVLAVPPADLVSTWVYQRHLGTAAIASTGLLIAATRSKSPSMPSARSTRRPQSSVWSSEVVGTMPTEPKGSGNLGRCL